MITNYAPFLNLRRKLYIKAVFENRVKHYLKPLSVLAFNFGKNYSKTMLKKGGGVNDAILDKKEKDNLLRVVFAIAIQFVTVAFMKITCFFAPSFSSIRISTFLFRS